MGINLVQHVRALRGGSCPHLCRADDGGLYVVKFLENPQGPRVLANELLASRLALHLSLPVPRTEVVFLPGDLADAMTHVSQFRICPGIHVGIPLVIGPLQGRSYDALPSEYIRHLRNWSKLLQMQVFDYWVCNRDIRQAIFWKLSRERIYSVSFIDHGHCFGGPEWSMFHRPPAVCGVCSQDTAATVDIVSQISNIPDDLIAHYCSEIPPIWYQDGGPAIDVVEKALVARKHHLSQKLKELMTLHSSTMCKWKDTVACSPRLCQDGNAVFAC